MRLSEQFPNNLGVIFRKEFTDLRDSTLKDFETYTGMRVDSNRTARLPNGSEIMFRHMEEMANIQNMNLGWFGIEQAEELESDDQFFKLHGRLRREGSSRQGFIIANTNGHNWIYRLWKINKDRDYPLFEANIEDARAYLPADTLASWEKLKEAKPKIYNRFVMNSWEESDTTDVIIDPADVMAATKRDLNVRPPVRRIVSCDVARYGDDKTVAYAIENGKAIAKAEWEKKSTMETVGLLTIFAKRHGDIQSFAIDEIGVGSGVVDRLRELNHDVIAVNASEKAAGSGFYNRRAEIYQKGADMFHDGLVQLLPDDNDLIEQLSWAKYREIKSNGVFQVEAKEDIKKRYGRSPDNADAFLNGLWALPRARVAVARDGYSNPSRAYHLNPATV